MAAHSLTILAKLATSFVIYPEKVSYDMKYAPGYDELSVSDWHTLDEAVKSLGEKKEDDDKLVAEQVVRETAWLILARQIEEWDSIGRPRTHEEFVRSRHEMIINSRGDLRD